jgi:acylglycerol lipase
MPIIKFLSRTFLVFTSLVCTACTPLVNRPGEASKTPFMGRSHFTAADGAVLPVRSWFPSEEPIKAVIVALHGFNDYSLFFNAPGEFLSRRGFACYAYDQRGFGNAPGRGLWAGLEAYVDDLKTFTDLLRLRHPGFPLYVLGESMGGAVAIVAMTSTNPPDADGLILSSPAVWGRATMPWYQRALLETLAHTTPWLRLTGSGLKIRASDNIEMLRKLGRDPLFIKATRVDAMYGLTNLMDAALASVGQLNTPTLVLYGEHDQIIPREPVIRMLGTMQEPPQTQVAYYQDGYHMLLRDLQADKPLGGIVAWIENRKAPLPSGADQRVALGLAQTR